MTAMTPAELTQMGQRARESAALAEAATAGPWKWEPTRDSGYVPQGALLGDTLIQLADDYEGYEGDLAFIAASRTAVPALARDVAALLAYVDAQAKELEAWRNYKPDDETLAALKMQYGDGDGKAARRLYVVALETRVRELESERAVLLERIEELELSVRGLSSSTGLYNK